MPQPRLDLNTENGTEVASVLLCGHRTVCGNTEQAHGQIRRVFGAIGGITYGSVAREIRLVRVLDSVGWDNSFGRNKPMSEKKATTCHIQCVAYELWFTVVFVKTHNYKCSVEKGFM